MKKIVVITSGWVVMGDVTEHEDRLNIDDASVIRVWGTTAGLGEIALNGPTASTVLDPAGVVEVYKPAVIMQIPCTYAVK
jgi:hypothetical protein